MKVVRHPLFLKLGRGLLILAVVLFGVLAIGSTSASNVGATRHTPPTGGRPQDSHVLHQVADGMPDLDDLRQIVAYQAPSLDAQRSAGSGYALLQYIYDPLVVETTSSSPVALIVKTDGSVTSMTADLQAGGSVAATQLFADTFQLAFTPAQVLYNYTTGDHHNFFGFLNAYVGATLAIRLNLTVNVGDSLVPTVPQLQLAADALAGPHVVNLHVPLATPGSYDPSILQRFYQLRPDSFDFMSLVYTDATIANRTHMLVRNMVQGIGLTLYDNSATYGSSGRLIGITNFPVSQFFDGAESGFQHELAHQWINFAMSPGIPHWPISELAQGVVGMSIPGSGGVGGAFPYELTSNGDGSYTLHYNPDLVWQVGFTDLDLYLMGLMPPEQVGPALVFSNQDQTAQLHDAGVLQGPTYLVDASTIVATRGTRVPSFMNSPHEFTAATIIVTRDRLLTPEELAFFDYMAARASFTQPVPFAIGLARGVARPFYLTTHSRGSLDATVLDQVFIPLIAH